MASAPAEGEHLAHDARVQEDAGTMAAARAQSGMNARIKSEDTEDSASERRGPAVQQRNGAVATQPTHMPQDEPGDANVPTVDTALMLASIGEYKEYVYLHRTHHALY